MRSTPEALMPSSTPRPMQEERGELGDADARRDREALELHDAAFDGARDQAGDDQETDDDHDALEQRPEGEGGLARDQVDAVERAFDALRTSRAPGRK